jgi:copper chaperone CopZ
MASVTLRISGMHCSHCRVKVEQALQKVAGVYGAAVDLDAGMAEVDFDGKAAPEALVAAVQAVGYSADVST